MPLRFLPKQKLAIATAIYWFLLLYIIAALFFWFAKLQQQNQQMAQQKLMELVANDPDYIRKVEMINEEARRKTMQFNGEGITFLLIILVGAVFVFRAVRRQFKTAQQQQNFMMAITHELKTPIAVAKLNLETLQKHRLDEEKQMKLIQMTLQETNRLNTLTNNILLSSQLEAGGYKMVLEDIAISNLAEKLMTDLQHRYPDRLMEWNIQPGQFIKGDPVLIEIMMNNLLDNALKYSPKDSPIILSLYDGGTGVILQVKDQGIGIPNEEKQKIFERFYRIGNEAVRKTKGTGLGLFLCKKIATDHHALINVSDNDPRGSIFTIQFRIKR